MAPRLVDRPKPDHVDVSGSEPVSHIVQSGGAGYEADAVEHADHGDLSWLASIMERHDGLGGDTCRIGNFRGL